ncbi:tRNA (guanine-N1)-methyltransferase [Paenibacillus yonginensis]|uniref:tRNA (guanine-N(1)-)-methyltransferase n=1 Tax=Paenibacillus yonginensis TaxID=1462996 RepID=A0A1B1MXQ6_9BACL|nr:tRNA (guanosine(37)-N1)-methyltransferase TrmD [Paenibacillus yonginensis]ANS73961.1 tRNA (guanine-N1)-methyltransferase [Paenibacillus yonginensis]
MRVDVLTLFPEMFTGVFGTSILGKAQEKGIVSLNAINFRDYSESKHGTVDDTPYGGGGGMVLKPEPIFRAVEALLSEQAGEKVSLEQRPEGEVPDPAGTLAEAVDSSLGQARQRESGSKRPPRVILLCPQGEPFTQAKAEELAREDHLIMICGHYEGYDERIREHLVTDEISVGDYVLTGGELPAMVVTDSVIRLLPGVLGNETSAVTDSFSTGLLEYPHYTRPVEFRGWKVPDILLSGHHSNIDAWRRKEALRRTWKRRPDLLDKLELTQQDKLWLKEIQASEEP